MRTLLLLLALSACSSHEEPTVNADGVEATPTAEAPAPAAEPVQEGTAAPVEAVPGATDPTAQDGATTQQPAGGVARGQPCEGQTCADGMSCVSYYGIAGPSGPKFTSCETPCGTGKSECGPGLSCVTIADGPGQVCRP